MKCNMSDGDPWLTLSEQNLQIQWILNILICKAVKKLHKQVVLSSLVRVRGSVEWSQLIKAALMFEKPLIQAPPGHDPLKHICMENPDARANGTWAFRLVRFPDLIKMELTRQILLITRLFLAESHDPFSWVVRNFLVQDDILSKDRY